MTWRFLPGVVLSVAMVIGCAEPDPPRLVVVVVVDQMRADYVERFGRGATGGLRRLLDEGTRFEEAYFAHAMTGTAPGHTTISTGADPRIHGIFEKQWFDREHSTPVRCERDPDTRLVGPDLDGGASPRQMLASTLGDWLKEASPQSKVFSVALKPRAAILMAGARADAAFWFSREHTRFVTSDFYLDRLPEWADAFNARDTIFQFEGHPWELLYPTEAYLGAREDNFAAEFDGIQTSFPHDFHASPGTNADSTYARALLYSPFGDDLTWQFTRELVHAEALGQDQYPDLLFIGCSAADFVGHLYGPWSQEVHDYFLRLDTYLARGFAWLDENVGRENYLAVLTSDHGVAMLPEEARRRGMDAGRVVHQDFASDREDSFAALAEDLGLETPPILHASHEGVYLDYPTAAAAGIDAAALERAMKEHLGRLGYVDRVFTRAELVVEPDGEDRILDSFRRSYTPGRAPDVMVLYRENWVVDTYPGGTDHGTPYAYDSHVPLVLLGGDWKAAVSRLRVDLVDVAPTLAAELRVRPASTARGRDLKGLVR